MTSIPSAPGVRCRLTGVLIKNELDKWSLCDCRLGKHCQIRAYELREQIRGSDLYSPLIKRVMERFWERCDRLAELRKNENT
jgi:hypothetical protein